MPENISVSTDRKGSKTNVCLEHLGVRLQDNINRHLKVT